MNRPDSEGSAVWGWVIVLGIAVAIIVWGTLQYLLVKDVPRDWSYGSLPETPGSSVYSTGAPPVPAQGQAPRQIEPLPGSKPLKSDGSKP